jgi:diguanylate cyclase (GGDEF)-like protein
MAELFIPSDIRKEGENYQIEKKENDQQKKIEALIRESLDMCETYREQILREHSPAARHLLEKFDYWYRYLAMAEYYNDDETISEEKRQTSRDIVMDLTGKNRESFSWLLIKNHAASEKADEKNKNLLQNLAPVEQGLLSNVLECYNNARVERMADLVTFDLLCRDMYNFREYQRLYQAEIEHVKRQEKLSTERRDTTSCRHQPSFLVSIDFNDFGDINKRISDLVGDQVLVEFSKTLKSLFRRETDKIARPHGDEFKIITRAKSEKLLLAHLAKLIAASEEITVSYRDDMNRLQVFTGLKIKVALTEITKDDSSDPRNRSWESPDSRTSVSLLLNKRSFLKSNDKLTGVTVVSNNESSERQRYLPFDQLTQE